jgi:hypothetical protein
MAVDQPVRRTVSRLDAKVSKFLTPISEKWATPSCALPFCVPAGMVTVYVWLGGEKLRLGAYGPKVRMVPIISAGGEQGLPERQDWSPMATDTSCELESVVWISYPN